MSSLKNLTPEEKKERIRMQAKKSRAKCKDKTKARNKAWREANKDKVKADAKVWREKNPGYSKAWRDNNPDKIRANQNAHNKRHPEKLKALRKNWMDNNRDKIAARNRRYKEKNTLPYFIVYGIMGYNEAGYNYCGQTNQPKIRMTEHKTFGKDISEWMILDICQTREEALAIEAQYHDQGYYGRNITSSNKN